MSKQQQITFSIRDAGDMLAIARTAPINNMEQAEARANLFARYQAWANLMLSPQILDLLAPKPAEPAEKPAETAEPAAETAALPENG